MSVKHRILEYKEELEYRIRISIYWKNQNLPEALEFTRRNRTYFEE